MQLQTRSGIEKTIEKITELGTEKSVDYKSETNLDIYPRLTYPNGSASYNVTKTMHNNARGVEVVMAAEALPSLDIESGQVIANLSAKLERSYHKLIESNMRTSCGNDFALDCVGLYFTGKVTAPSSYKGHIGSVEQFSINFSSNAKAVIVAAAIKGYVQDQEAVTIRSLVPSLEGANDVWSFNCSRVITNNEMFNIRHMLTRYGINPDDDVALVTSKDGIDILNISGMKQSMFRIIPDILSRILEGEFYACNNNFASEEYHYGYIGADSLNEAQSKYLEIITEFNSSNNEVQQVCLDLLEQKRKENRAITNKFIAQNSKSRSTVDLLSDHLCAA